MFEWYGRPAVQRGTTGQRVALAPSNNSADLESVSAGPRWIILHLQRMHTPSVFSITDSSAPLRVDALSHVWPKTLLNAFPAVELIQPILDRVRQEIDTDLVYSQSMSWPQYRVLGCHRRQEGYMR